MPFQIQFAHPFAILLTSLIVITNALPQTIPQSRPAVAVDRSESTGDNKYLRLARDNLVGICLFVCESPHLFVPITTNGLVVMIGVGYLFWRRRKNKALDIAKRNAAAKEKEKRAGEDTTEFGDRYWGHCI
jgi:hypothetical protein